MTTSKNEPVLKWWEKTVEYAFIMNAHERSLVNFAAPLSGVEEKAGDLILAQGTNFILVEFKATENDFDSDDSKFTDYTIAKQALTGQDTHHYFVFGAEAESEDEARMQPMAQKYFSRGASIDALKVFSAGWTKTAFDDYLEKFLTHKKKDGRSGSGAEQIRPQVLARVAGSGIQRGVALSLDDYCLKYAPQLVIGSEPDTPKVQLPFGKSGRW